MQNASREVAAGIHCVEFPLEGRRNRAYLFEGAARMLLVDAGQGNDLADHVWPYMERVGLDTSGIAHVVLTHADFDHAGGAGAVRRAAPSALLACGSRDRSFIEDPTRLIDERYNAHAREGIVVTPGFVKQVHEAFADHYLIDEDVSGGESIDLGDGWRVELVATPGHTAGSISVWDPRSRTLVVGDALMGTGVPNARDHVSFPPIYVDVEAYRRTALHVIELEPELLLATHYPAMARDACGAFARDSATFTEEVEATMMDELGKAPTSLSELCRRVGSSIRTWPADADADLAPALASHLQVALGRQLVEPVLAADAPTLWRRRS